MDKEQIEKKLNEIKDIPQDYFGKLWKLKSFKIDEVNERVNIVPYQGKHVDRSFESIDGFIAELKPLKNDTIAPVTKDFRVDEIVISLKDILMTDIEKIREDREYIPQALAVNRNVNTIINLARLQLKMIDK